MTTVKLDGSNYMNWKVAVEVYLIAKRKVYTIRRDPPAALDPTYEQWETDDAHIRSLLWQSMIPQISGTMMQLPTAKRIWDHTAVMFSGVGNLSRICATYSEWMHLRRGDTPLSTYYGQFVSHCQHLDIFMPLTTDLAVAARQRDQLRVVQFLETLGPEFIFFRQQIYGSGTIPSLEEVYQRAQQCLGGASLTPAIFYGHATAAYAVGDRPARGGGTFGRGRGRDSSRGGRTMDSDPRASSSGYSPAVPSFTQADYDELQRLRLAAHPPSAVFAQPGSTPASLLSSSSSWIIDSGASNHVTGTLSSLRSFHPLSSQCMTLADGRTTPISGTGSTSPYPGLTLSSVLCVPQILRLGGRLVKDVRYFVVFIDDYSRMTWLYLLHDRSEVFSAFRTFHSEVTNQFDCTLKCLRTDNAREYFSTTHGFQDFLSSRGILHQSSCAHTSQQNGVTERKMRSLLDGARSLLIQMQVPKSYWGDAVLTACHLTNRLPSSVLGGSSPFAVLYPGHDPFPITPKGLWGPRLRQSFVSTNVTFFESESYFVSSHETPSTVPDSDLSLPLPALPAPLISPPVLVPETIHVCDPSSSLQAPEATEAPPPAPPQTYPRRLRSTAHPPPPAPSSLQPEIDEHIYV
ncbi:uncharacterized protein LOC143853957 [Tasmannia lanceolata]|uniref:uncharacterized protein LOC143853957 n=1 Tax=Tasmannia lanceolata TaxID=3420 RepID=UPI0040646F6E